jgi:predicted N-acyltransferase
MTELSIPVCKKKEKDISLVSDNTVIQIFEKIDDIVYVWQKLSEDDIFLSPDYLRTLETAPADGITPYYVVVRENDRQIGILYFQWKFFRLHENIRDTKPAPHDIFQKLKKAVIKTINFPTLVCGNLLLTGEYGFRFSEEITSEKQWQLIDDSINSLQKYLLAKGRPVGLVIVKDFADSRKKYAETNEFMEFTVQPTMVMPVRKEWKNFENYTNSMKSKYRVRLKKARKDIESYQIRHFSAEEIRHHEDRIFSLYQNVSDQASFNTFVLHKNYFETLKQVFDDKLTFTTYWHKDIMVGFSTTIVNEKKLHAHFLGYDKEANRHCQLYLNMLYDIVGQSIEKQTENIDFSRTAIEIKSTVGAVDVPLYLYIKHSNTIWNNLVSPIVSMVKPDTDYIIRHPFKDHEG